MNTTIPEVFFDVAKKNSEKTALLYKKDGVYFPIQYQELAEKIRLVSVGLQNLGIKKNDKVAIFSENRPEWVIADLAIMAIGAVVVPLHTTFSAQAISKVLHHAEVKIVIVSGGELLNKILLLGKKIPSCQTIIFLDPIPGVQKKKFGKKIISWKRAFGNIKKPTDTKKIAVQATECATIIYTSGATGEPKGVMLSHANLISNVEAVNKAIPVKKKDIFLSFLPLSHVLERMGGYYTPLFFGATIAYAEGIKQLPNNLREVSPSILVSVPRIFEKMHDTIWDKVNASSNVRKKLFYWALHQKKGSFLYVVADWLVFKKIKKQLGGNLRLAISGGASLNENIGKFFSKIGVTILEGYGLTETSPVLTVNTQDYCKFGTVGRALGGVGIAISQDKEILAKGPNIALGYFNNDKEWKACRDSDGWFHTGDLGFIDSNGFLTIIGRKKEMIVLSGGKNVWPEPIENLLNNDKYISQSMIIGDNQKFISAFIVPDWEEVKLYLKKNNIRLKSHVALAKDPIVLLLFQRRIDEKINANLSEFEKIKKFVVLPQEFSQEYGELTPTLKLRRHIITMHRKKLIESLYR